MLMSYIKKIYFVLFRPKANPALFAKNVTKSGQINEEVMYYKPII